MFIFQYFKCQIEDSDKSGGADESTTRIQMMAQVLKEISPNFKSEAAQEDTSTDDSTSLIPYFKWICHPHSFSKTIENMFHTSFLLKEGVASLSIRNEELYIGNNLENIFYLILFIAPSEPHTPADFEGGQLSKTQSIMEMSIPLWKVLCPF